MKEREIPQQGLAFGDYRDCSELQAVAQQVSMGQGHPLRHPRATTGKEQTRLGIAPITRNIEQGTRQPARQGKNQGSTHKTKLGTANLLQDSSHVQIAGNPWEILQLRSHLLGAQQQIDARPFDGTLHRRPAQGKIQVHGHLVREDHG